MELKDFKHKKERGLTNSQFMDKSKEFFLDADAIVVVGLNPDGVISTFRTQDSSIQTIGMMEIAKQQLCDEMRCD